MFGWKAEIDSLSHSILFAEQLLPQFVDVFSNVYMNGFRVRRHDNPSVNKFVTVALGRFEIQILFNRDGVRIECRDYITNLTPIA